jgi:hypothetical protein
MLQEQACKHGCIMGMDSQRRIRLRRVQENFRDSAIVATDLSHNIGTRRRHGEGPAAAIGSTSMSGAPRSRLALAPTRSAPR